MASAGVLAPDETSVADAYRALAARDHLTTDTEQLACADALDALRIRLEPGPGRSGLRLIGGKRPAPRGLYIWGPVGRGKTLLMDLFFSRVRAAGKRRVHFHEFMDEMHDGIAAFRANELDRGKGRRDPIPAVTGPIVAGSRLLCFDEFHVTDIADAMLLGRLFEALWAGGVVIVATSNVAPARLYERGLNRELVLPFIARLEERCDIWHLDAATDYRREKLATRPVFFFGTGEPVRSEVDAVWATLTGGAGEPETVELMGRKFAVPAQAMGAARFSFAQLCETPLGARDYLRLARRYHTFVIDNVPTLERTRSDAAKRFIALIDTLYDRGVKLVASFEAPLDELGADDVTSFEFKRCVSRLIEMQSADYFGRAAYPATSP